MELRVDCLALGRGADPARRASARVRREAAVDAATDHAAADRLLSSV